MTTTLPKLPAPTIIDNRSLYTAGDMRDYAKAYAAAFMATIDASRINSNASGQPPTTVRDTANYGKSFDQLLQSMGIKK